MLITHHLSLFVGVSCRLPLSEDPALAMAFSVARKAAAVPLLLVNGTYMKTVRAYLDSSILQHQLQRIDHASLKGLTPRNSLFNFDYYNWSSIIFMKAIVYACLKKLNIFNFKGSLQSVSRREGCWCFNFYFYLFNSLILRKAE